MSDTNRPVELLPTVHQTERLRRFFGATVDPAFTRGRAEPISGYIGQQPPYTDPLRDFYLAEPTAERAFYQLEAMMVQSDAGGVAQRALPYEDLIGWLASAGADVSNHERLFEAPYYTWAPPVDVDKINNPRLYLWFGQNPEALPTLPLVAPIRLHAGDGTANRFAMPPVLAADPNGLAEKPDVFVISGGTVERRSDFVREDDEIVLSSPPPAGSDVAVLRHGDLRRLLVGRTTASIEGLTFGNLVRRHVGDGQTNRFALPSTQHNGATAPVVIVNGILLSDGYSILGNEVLLSNTPDPEAVILTIRHGSIVALGEAGGDPNRVVVALGAAPALMPALTSNMRVRFLDAAWSAERFFVEGVGRAIRLVPNSRMVSDIAPQFTTVERGSFDQNPWSRRNWWVHRDSFAWAKGAVFPDLRSRRPIVEFLRDLRLWNYGIRRLTPVNGVITNGRFVGHSFDVEFDGETARSPSTYQSGFDGPWFWLVTERLPADNTFMDNGSPGDTTQWTPLRDGDRVLMTASPDLPVAFHDRIFRANLVPDPLGGGMILVLSAEPDVIQLGDMVEVIGTDVEFWYDGLKWALAQEWGVRTPKNPHADPLFMLYDAERNSLNDPGVYPGSDFDGSRIFGFAGGDGIADSVLRRPIKRDKRGQIIFEADAHTRKPTFRNGTATSLALHRFLPLEGTSFFSSTWLPVRSASRQPRNEAGLFPIPLNLQANPDNDDPTLISRSDFFEQFRDIVEQQQSFDPLKDRAFGSNSFRDSAKDLTVGDRILQHSAPLLRLMLHAAAPDLDILTALRWCEAEYARFRAKFQRRTVVTI